MSAKPTFSFTSLSACLSLISVCQCAVMQQHGSGDGKVSRRTLFEEYLRSHVAVCPEPGPCRDVNFLSRAAQVLLLSPMLVPKGSATLTRLYPLVMEKIMSTGHLSELVRATEVLETLCLNLYLQPWRREIRSLKTFTGAFVYCLAPALTSNTLQCILAAIGYLPYESGPSPSEYRLCEEVSREQALQVAFDLLLTRSLCLHLLQSDKLTVQEPEALKRKVLPAELQQCTENTSDKTELEDGESHKTEEEQNSEASQEAGLAEDQSIFPLHVTYPDLVFRGRPLLPDQDCSLSQHTVPSHHRPHAQRHRVPPESRQTNHNNTEEEGLSGPVGLSLHITLRPQSSGFPICARQHQTADIGGLNNCPIMSEAEEEQRHLFFKPAVSLIKEDVEVFPLDHPTSAGSDSEEDTL